MPSTLARSPLPGKKRHSICSAYSELQTRPAKRLKPERRLQAHQMLRLAAWNMSYLSKTQLQFLDLLGHDVVFLSEVHDTAVLLADYGGEGGTQGHAGTWKLPALGKDGRVKIVQLDITFCNAPARPLFMKVRNHWFPSRIRWRKERHDHALQASWLRLKLVKPTSPLRVRQLKQFYKLPVNVTELRTAFHTAWEDAVGSAARWCRWQRRRR